MQRLCLLTSFGNSKYRIIAHSRTMNIIVNTLRAEACEEDCVNIFYYTQSFMWRCHSFFQPSALACIYLYIAKPSAGFSHKLFVLHITGRPTRAVELQRKWVDEHISPTVVVVNHCAIECQTASQVTGTEMWCVCSRRSAYGKNECGSSASTAKPTQIIIIT